MLQNVYSFLLKLNKEGFDGKKIELVIRMPSLELKNEIFEINEKDIFIHHDNWLDSELWG